MLPKQDCVLIFFSSSPDAELNFPSMGTSSVLWNDFSSNWKHVFTACFSSILEGCYLIPVSSPHITLTQKFLPAWHLHPILVCGLLQTWAFQGQVLQTGDISSLGEIATWKLPTAGRSVAGTQWITMPWMLALSTRLDPPSGNGGEKNKIKKKPCSERSPSASGQRGERVKSPLIFSLSAHTRVVWSENFSVCSWAGSRQELADLTSPFISLPSQLKTLIA